MIGNIITPLINGKAWEYADIIVNVMGVPIMMAIIPNKPKKRGRPIGWRNCSPYSRTSVYVISNYATIVCDATLSGKSAI